MAKSLQLGSCCADCFDAINYIPKELPDDRAAAAAVAGKALSALADREGVQSLHTGEEEGFSWSACCGCGSTLGGERFQLFGLVGRKDN